MPQPAPRPIRRRHLWAAGLWLATGSGLSAQPATLPPPKPAPIVSGPVTEFATASPICNRYTLGEALSIAHGNHPQLAALRASMNAALLKQEGLGQVKRTTSIVSGLVIPDYDIRMEQSELGLLATRAELAQAEHEVTYGVVRCYYAVVYARAQAKVARELVEQLEVSLETIKKMVASKGGTAGGPKGPRPVTQNTVDQLAVGLGEARLRLIQAEEGATRARAALRQAMGLDPLCVADIVDDQLPEIPYVIPRDTVIAHAVTRRGEVQLAEIGADVTRLEVYAQWTRKLSLMTSTFANASDIHARPLPAGHHDPDYRPAALGPEMPDRLLGKAETRAAAAGQYAIRSAEVVRHTKSLVALEAEVAWARWAEATRQVAEARKAAASGRALINRQREAAGGAAQEDIAILNEASAARAFASLNEALYDQVIAIANLERVTAGGVRINFPTRTCPGR
jgi:outer membrane protein TolC